MLYLLWFLEFCFSFSFSSFCSPWVDKWFHSNILSPASISRFSLEFLSVCCLFPQRCHNHYLKLNILCQKSITVISVPRMDCLFSAYDALMFQVYRYLMSKVYRSFLSNFFLQSLGRQTGIESALLHNFYLLFKISIISTVRFLQKNIQPKK